MQQRDFTLNAMMYDPFSHLLYDYVGGIADCSKRRLQCCKDPNESFQEDAPRMLRAVRLAARCGQHRSRLCQHTLMAYLSTKGHVFLPMWCCP